MCNERNESSMWTFTSSPSLLVCGVCVCAIVCTLCADSLILLLPHAVMNARGFEISSCARFVEFVVHTVCVRSLKKNRKKHQVTFIVPSMLLLSWTFSVIYMYFIYFFNHLESCLSFFKFVMSNEMNEWLNEWSRMWKKWKFQHWNTDNKYRDIWGRRNLFCRRLRAREYLKKNTQQQRLPFPIELFFFDTIFSLHLK